jgi:hypothetical protein
LNRDDLDELHFITSVENVPSILANGILSHVRAARMVHRSVAMPEIQDRRSKVVVPGTGRKLHEYANLYICARNPMLFKRRHEEICVLSVSTAVLDLKRVIVTDQNAAGHYVSFRAAPDGLRYVSRELVFAEDWRDRDQIQYWRKKAAKCAEVLVPDRVNPKYIQHACVASVEMKTRMDALNTGLEVRVDRHLFFR